MMFERLRRNAASGGLQFDPSSLLGLANVSPNLIAIAVDGTFVFANPAADGFLCAGRSGELLGRQALDWIHPEDRARAGEMIEEVGATGQAPVWSGIRLVSSDGRVLTLDVSATPVEFGGRRGLIFNGRDDSETRRAHAALVESERRYQSLAAAAPVSIFRLDAYGNCVYLNRRWSEVTGIPIEEAIGRSWLELVVAPGKELARKVWAKITSAPAEYRAEHEIGHRDGSSVHALTQVVPETDADGRVVGYVGTSTDLSELKRAQHALARSEERLRLALQAASLVIWEADLNSSRIEWSEGAASVLGLPDGALPSDLNAAWALIRPDYMTFRDGSARESLESGEPFEVEARLPIKGIPPRWVLARGQAHIDASRNSRRIVGVVADVTARRQIAEERAVLEQKLVEAQRLESLGLLAGGVAHDFNNLLVGILGNAELALARLGGDAPARALVEGIREAGLRAAELAHQILAYSGNQPTMRQRVDLAALARDTLLLLRTSLPPHARLSVEAPDRPAWVAGDPTQLRQVLMNLLLNAGEALPKSGGEVRVRIEHLSEAAAEESSPAEWVVLDVADSGVGMDAQTRARIFDPFFTTRTSGRGLGLAVVHGLVRGHGGTIEVESEAGVGTRMRVRLPAAMPEAEAARVAGEAPSEREAEDGARVLVVDDERAVREVVRLTLELAGHRVLLAANAAEAHALLETHAGAIDAIVLDLTLGTESSEQVLSEIRARSADVPVLVTSGYPEEDAIGRLAGLGISAFVQKPFTPARLTAAVSRALAERTRTRSD
jgi:two-component system cell cycle sensor histidine kinase/response regulator CckA